MGAGYKIYKDNIYIYLFIYIYIIITIIITINYVATTQKIEQTRTGSFYHYIWLF